MTSLLVYQKPAFLRRLIARLEQRSAVIDGCRVWQGVIGYDGYGITSAGNKPRKVHRVAWELKNGPIPDGLFVLHHCDNRPCFQTDPDDRYPNGHLFLGTNKDNTRDMYSKGRAAPLTLYGNTKTTLTQRNEMRKRRANGERVKDIAASMGFPASTVSSITVGNHWKIDTEIVASQVEQLGVAAASDDVPDFAD